MRLDFSVRRSFTEGFGVSLVVSDPVRDVVAAVGKLRVDDRLITDPSMLLGDCEALLDSINGVQAVLVRRLREVTNDVRTVEITGRGTRAWLHEEQLLSGSDASRLMRLATYLPLHPVTEAAFADGSITAQHAAAILTALNSVPAELRDPVEPHLIERARCYPPEEIGGFVDELLQRLGIDTNGDIRRERRNVTRGVSLATTLHGNRSLSGTLTADVGQRLQTALAAAAQPSRPEDDRTPRQRRHDALGAIADAYLQRTEPSFTGAPRTVIVTVDLDTLENQLRQRWIATPFGALAPDTVRRLACDAEIIPVVLGSNSEVLDIGVANHEFTTAIRRAAYIRDNGHCVFPHCRNPCIELHHIVFRRHNGPTSLANAAWLCAFHHWLVHEGGWTLKPQQPDGYLWTNPAALQLHRHPESA